MVKGLARSRRRPPWSRTAANTPTPIEELWRRAGIPVAALERLAEADAFRSLALDRRGAIWEIRALSDTPLPLFAAADAGRIPAGGTEPGSS